MKDINYETSLNKLLDDIFIIHRGVRIEKNQGGYILWGGWHSSLDTVKRIIDESYSTTQNSIK